MYVNGLGTSYTYKMRHETIKLTKDYKQLSRILSELPMSCCLQNQPFDALGKSIIKYKGKGCHGERHSPPFLMRVSFIITE